jgi:hypothetical protein
VKLTQADVEFTFTENQTPFRLYFTHLDSFMTDEEIYFETSFHPGEALAFLLQQQNE